MKTTRRTFLGAAAVITLPIAPAASGVRATAPSVDDFLAKATPSEKARYHANALAEAMNEHRPGTYRASVNHEYGFAMVVDDAWKKQMEGPLLPADRNQQKLYPAKRQKVQP